jgi:hypothetical protein
MRARNHDPLAARVFQHRAEPPFLLIINLSSAG